MPEYDAVVVGSGPNGLAAAITLAREGWSVAVYEGKDIPGGGMRTLELTLPGFHHDLCSAIHPLGLASPFFRSLPLADYGLEWIQPEIQLAHPFDDGFTAVMYQSVDKTAAALGADGPAYAGLMRPFAERWQDLLDDILGPFPLPPHHPFLLGRFGLGALQPASWLARRLFRQPYARGFFAGMAAHAIIPLETIATASFGMVLGILGHAVGWPIPRGGSQSIANAMVAHLEKLGGKIITDTMVNHIDELPTATAYLFDVTPRQLVRIAGSRLSESYKHQLGRYRYGPGVFKVDWALRGPIPWKNPECAHAGTVHLGPTLEDIAVSERASAQGRIPEHPFVLVAQQSLFDDTRAPADQQTGWAYCHVPNGSTVDVTEHIEAQIERFAPGFRDQIIERHTFNAAEMEQHNPNYIGGDINGGVQDLLQLYTRPTLRRSPYTTSAKGIYICSSSTPPGGGVHGMCGYHAAHKVLQDFRR
jgi:phytoene dehydrogenase-like protein